MIPEYPDWFARNCQTCLPPKGCTFPRIGGPRQRGCPDWNDNPFRTTSSGSGIEKKKKAWEAAGYLVDYIPSPPTSEELADEGDDGE